MRGTLSLFKKDIMPATSLAFDRLTDLRRLGGPINASVALHDPDAVPVQPLMEEEDLDEEDEDFDDDEDEDEDEDEDDDFDDDDDDLDDEPDDEEDDF